MAEEGNIIIRGASENNLQHINLEIPRGKFVVITGVSGSGKSSLAFDTLYAEGQRRFAESLSSYTRQFLGRMKKPEVESIEGIPPAIAIEQKVISRNVRSTVGTMTEIYDYLRLIFARIGRTYSPVSGLEVKKHSARDVADYIRGLGEDLPDFDSKDANVALLLSDIGWKDCPGKVELMLSLVAEGFSRVLADGKLCRIEDILKEAQSERYPDEVLLVIDRIRLPLAEDFDMDRLLGSIEKAFSKGGGALTVRVGDFDRRFSTRYEADGMTFSEPDEYLLSFNSPLGACPTCGGYGRVVGISEDLVVPDKSRSIYDGAIACWRGDKMGWFKEKLIEKSPEFDIPIFVPWCNIPEEKKRIIWEGTGNPETDGEDRIIGLNEFFKWVESKQYKIQYKYMLSRYSGKSVCPDCHGSRLKKEALYIKVGGKDIAQLLSMSAEELLSWTEGLRLEEWEMQTAEKALEEVRSRLRCLCHVGLGYLSLARASNTLSGGESQRVNIVRALGSPLVGSIYILDEPSIGLHSRDTDRLIGVLRQLRDAGNTVLVVEHDEEIMRAADLLIDMGPLAGSGGGRIVWQGQLDGQRSPESLTLAYLSGERKPYERAKRVSRHHLTVKGALQNNLKDITVDFPLDCLCVVSGVSGSGKSSLVGEILYPALNRKINEAGALPGTFRGLEGEVDRIDRVEYVDQSPFGKSSRSNAVTALKVYDDIRKLLTSQPLAKINGYTPSHFSFNQDGGRCPECQGDGVVRISMQFMSDVTMVCESCGGKRFKPDILEVRYRGKNVDDILNMSVSEAIAFFGEDSKDETARRIARRLQPLVDVGLSYIKLGQQSNSFSGGESQRLKLAYFLSMTEDSRRERILFIFDEPTTGLHFYDIDKLLMSFDRLLEKGHSILVVEHNPIVLKSADWIIDLGPDAGDKGGQLVYAGTVEDMLRKGKGVTAEYLRKSL
ncbi:MAG: excinuclease ABC subunit UvrA [Bacteroidales bacterium]|nr:excinuclease ABC subunit UvrA [Bacteroidales bacterium]